MLKNIKYNAAIKKMYDMDQVNLAHIYDFLRHKKASLEKTLKFLKKQELTYNLEILEKEQQIHQIVLAMTSILQATKYKRNKCLEQPKKTKNIVLEEPEFLKLLFSPPNLKWYEKIWPFRKKIETT